jgi:AcrR family transcriptional regulator
VRRPVETREPTPPADPRRSIERLWGRHEPGRRGPKPKLSLEEVVAAATDLADREGLASLSIRRVSEALGLSPMALYTYASSKAELVDLMTEHVWQEVELPGDDAGDWRAKLAFIARQEWALAHRHPWLLEIALLRPALGPSFIARVDASFRALDRVGLEDVEIELVARLIGDYVRGAVRSAIEAREIEQRTGMSEEQWVAAAEPALLKAMDAEAFPVLRRVGAACRIANRGGFDRAKGFEFGLQRVLDGVEVFIQRKAR